MPHKVIERNVLVLFGSETGNAQDMAEDVGRLCERQRFRAEVEEMNSIDLNTLVRYPLVMFIISTTGQGDMPHNSLLFWKRLLRKKLPPGCLSRLRYTIFGLGDSTYPKFNWAARKLQRRLDQLGAKTFIEGFEADEQFPDGVDGSFLRWSDGLRQHLLDQYPHPDGLQSIPESEILPPRWSLEAALIQSTDSVSRNGVDSEYQSLGADHAQPSSVPMAPGRWQATLVESKRMTPETHWQDVCLITFDVPPRHSQKLECNPGDCLTIYPQNFPEDVQKLIILLNWTNVADQPLDLSTCPSLPRGLRISNRCTIRDILLECIDFNAVPRRSFLKNLAHLTTDPDHKERLLEFTIIDHLDEYFDYATRPRRSIIEVLEEFTSVTIPPSRLFDMFPLILGRDFSIANGGLLLSHPTDPAATRVQLLVALVKYRTILRKPRQGLCSRYLSSLSTGCTLAVTHKPVLSPIHGPSNAARPLIAMATGTGVAPARSLIHERLTHPSPGPMTVYFGNRNRNADFFFQEEWEALQAQGKLRILTAFSRDQREKIYIQDLLGTDTAPVQAALSEEGIFTVCGGSTKMAEACKRAVFEPSSSQNGQTDTDMLLSSKVTWWQEIW